MKCRNCGRNGVEIVPIYHIVNGRRELKKLDTSGRKPCPYCGEANWSDERHHI